MNAPGRCRTERAQRTAGPAHTQINPDRPHDKLPYRGAWLWIGPEMIHLMVGGGLGGGPRAAAPASALPFLLPLAPGCALPSLSQPPHPTPQIAPAGAA